MSSFTRLPCAECGKLTLVNTADQNGKPYCDVFCEARAKVKARRGGTASSSRPKPNTSTTIRRKGCSRCGGI